MNQCGVTGCFEFEQGSTEMVHHSLAVAVALGRKGGISLADPEQSLWISICAKHAEQLRRAGQ